MHDKVAKVGQVTLGRVKESWHDHVDPGHGLPLCISH